MCYNIGEMREVSAGDARKIELTEKHRLTKGVTDVPQATDSGE